MRTAALGWRAIPSNAAATALPWAKAAAADPIAMAKPPVSTVIRKKGDPPFSSEPEGASIALACPAMPSPTKMSNEMTPSHLNPMSLAPFSSGGHQFTVIGFFRPQYMHRKHDEYEIAPRQ
jgi:hypothetical protein